jgi:aminocarboxymuconate-semialdehyde decarboxylase
MPPSLTDVDGMLEARARAGIDLTIIGSPVGAGAMARIPGVDNYAQPRDRLRRFHAWLSGLIGRFPDQLRGYVYANPFGDDDHLEGVRESLADPAFVGLITTSSVHGELLGSARADSFFALAAEAGVPVLVHAPAEPVGTDRVDHLGFVEQIGRFHDVSLSMAAIAFAGWLEKYPALRLIGSTGGGALALLPERLRTAARPGHWGPPGPPGAPGGVGGGARPSGAPGSSGAPGASGVSGGRVAGVVRPVGGAVGPRSGGRGAGSGFGRGAGSGGAGVVSPSSGGAVGPRSGGRGAGSGGLGVGRGAGSGGVVSPSSGGVVSVDPVAALRRMYVDTSTFSAVHVGLNVEVLGPERMLFGTDSPPLSVPLGDLVRMIEKLPVDAAAQQLILGGNAEAVFDLRSRP